MRARRLTMALLALGAIASVVSWRCAVAIPDPDGGSSFDGGGTVPDGGARDGGPDGGGDAGIGDAGLPDGGQPDGGALPDGGSAEDAGAGEGGGLDGGADGGGADGGGADGGGADGGGADACAADAGFMATCGTTQLFETADPSGPSAFDFAQGRSMFLSTDVNPTQGDVYLLSVDRATGVTADNEKLALVSASEHRASGGERGVFHATGIEDLTALTDGGVSSELFRAIPADLVFQKGTETSSHRVLVQEGHVYVFELDFDGAPKNYAAMVVDRMVTPVTDGGTRLTDRQFVEVRWLYQSEPGVRTFDRGFPPPP